MIHEMSQKWYNITNIKCIKNMSNRLKFRKKSGKPNIWWSNVLFVQESKCKMQDFTEKGIKVFYAYMIEK